MVKAEQIFLVYLKTNIISFPGIISAIFEKGEKIGGGGEWEEEGGEVEGETCHMLSDIASEENIKIHV